MQSFLKPPKQQPKHVVDPSLQPWIEKYRPKTMDDISAQEHTVQVLKKTLGSNNLPHMLFYGPPGTGKTSTILALSRELFGPELFRSRVLELNASDERGISVVREKIKNFARQTPRAADAEAARGYPCPPYKIIILDEADSMTQDAQAALRRVMETYAKITRFCLVCNYVTRIIEPLASRCSKFRFHTLDASSNRARLEFVAHAEGVSVTPPVIDALITTSDGDLRRSITYLQSAHRLAASTVPPTQIQPRDIQEIAGVIPDAVAGRFAASLGVEGEDVDVDMDVKTKGYDGVRKAVQELVLGGYSATQVLSQLHDIIILHPLITGQQKSRCALIFAEVDKNLSDGADEELQLLDMGLRVWKALR
ncbi:P-loop containing nucleoside triphosphate hydrolase protein [Calocera cornea HHB12733]|uniref:Replication factor C subunit 2 n=1 Tax=Calocera cornea HHB12733 TaxID=1353952 RepID=A0A165DBS1_9BASI|nr:P-loop containing nucleoside triphosphate hydrolase protein [Calocera cornea HHB12733]